MKNGDGLRVVLWVSGCTHHCKGCHNPQTWDPDSGILFDADAETELWDELDKDYISGITFSGGDPLAPCNIETVSRLIRYIRARYGNSKTIWVYTGYTIEELLANWKKEQVFWWFKFMGNEYCTLKNYKRLI